MRTNNYFSSVGNTPLIKISRQLYAKLETYNPTGSIKDRMIAYVVKRAQERGEFGEDQLLSKPPQATQASLLPRQAQRWAIP